MSKNLIFRLPQSLIRSLGIEDIASYNFFQTNFIRNPNQEIDLVKIEKSIYNLNEIIVKSIKGNKSSLNFMNLLDKKLIFPKHALVDYNLITSLETNRGLKQISNLAILPYDSSVLNPKLKDIRYFKSFLKSAKDCYYIWRNSNAKFCYNWVDMITVDNDEMFIPWFWKPKKLSLNLYLARIRDVASSLSGEFEFMNSFLNCLNPILIQYTEYSNEINVEKQLENIFNTSNIFRERIKQPGAEIFLKPHRTNTPHRDNRLTWFKGIKVNRPSSIEESFIPSEVFINSRNSNFLLVSEWSSSLFNFQIKDLIPVSTGWDDLVRKDFYKVKLTLIRLSRFKDLESLYKFI